MVAGPRLARVTAFFSWDEFELDPRLPANALLRASDADRDVVHRALGGAYGDGRLDREEFDERSAAVLHARTLGDLPGMLADLVPVEGPRSQAVAPRVGDDSLQQRAEARYRSNRRQAIWAFISASLVCWVIWGLTTPGGFPWPAFVMLGTGIHAGRMIVMREDEVASERRRLERKEGRALGGGDAPHDSSG